MWIADVLEVTDKLSIIQQTSAAQNNIFILFENW